MRSTAEAFVEYADILSRRLGDRVKRWITHYEPWAAAFLGHQIGMQGPGLKDFSTALKVSHHLLLSHGCAVPVLRRNSPDAEIGITLNLVPVSPASSIDQDFHACREFEGYINTFGKSSL